MEEGRAGGLLATVPEDQLLDFRHRRELADWPEESGLQVVAAGQPAEGDGSPTPSGRQTPPRGSVAEVLGTHTTDTIVADVENHVAGDLALADLVAGHVQQDGAASAASGGAEEGAEEESECEEEARNDSPADMVCAVRHAHTRACIDAHKHRHAHVRAHAYTRMHWRTVRALAHRAHALAHRAHVRRLKISWDGRRPPWWIRYSKWQSMMLPHRALRPVRTRMCVCTSILCLFVRMGVCI